MATGWIIGIIVVVILIIAIWLFRRVRDNYKLVGGAQGGGGGVKGFLNACCGRGRY